MDYYIYKLAFSTAVHFGNGSLTDTNNQLMADTIFSALCIEASRSDIVSVDELVEYVENGELLISDGMPYIKDRLYIPKPIMPNKVEIDGDYTTKKLFKKLKYIPLDKVKEYMKSEFDPALENSYLKGLGKTEVRQLANLMSGDEAEPYFVGTYKFFEGNGLYIIAGFKSKDIKNIFDKLLECVSYEGIGGRRSAGLGKFKFSITPFSKDKLAVTVGCQSTTYITLSISMAKNDEITDIVNDSVYSLIKRSGFIYSFTYGEEFRKKKDFYAFKSGSCFSKSFSGGVFNVSGYGKHKVYRYCKPLFLEVK